MAEKVKSSELAWGLGFIFLGFLAMHGVIESHEVFDANR